jgi:DNA-binding MarR family transcriptional regulator
MTCARVTSSKYSPGNMTPEALEALFVGREKTLSDVLKRIAASATGEGKHFILLVGPRGVGKTHFIALAHHRLMTAPQYAAAERRLKVAYLGEEWGVASFVDFLVRVLDALASRYEDRGLEARIERLYDLHERDPVGARDLAEATLIDYIGKDTLLLLCENLEDIFAGLGDEGQKRLRSLIHEHPFCTILATTPALFAGVQLQTSPFFGFFTERHLDKLDLETAARLLQKKAEIDGRPELATALGTPAGRARVRAIHHLTNGNHRVYVTLSDFLDEGSLDDLVQPFVRMMDDLTPYYQDRMWQLAPQQRKIIELLSRREAPAMVKEIARRCLISQQTAAKQLGDLAKLGFVQFIKSGRATYYELAEPLMRICIEVNDNKTQHLARFVRFLREWFSTQEIDPAATIATTMQTEATLRGPFGVVEQVALTRTALDEPGVDTLFADALTRLLHMLIAGGLLQRQPWEEAVAALSRALRGLPACELPLHMLAAAARYSRTRDVTDLLDLSLEQRSLLLDAFAEQTRAPAPVAVPSPPSPRRSVPAVARAGRKAG